MSPFDVSKAFSDFWTAQGQALLKAQQQVGQRMADGMQAMASGTLPAMPEVPGLPTDMSGAAADLGRASQAVMELWSAATALSSQLAAKLPDPGGDATLEAVLAKMMDPHGALLGEHVLGPIAEGPRFADLWDVERRYARVLQAWMEVRRRALEHQAVVLGAWLQAGQRFAEGQAAAANGQPGDPKAVLALWTSTANTQLIETQRSEPFLRTQAAMIRANTALRLAQQDLVEHFGKQYGFPTRTELDDVHRSLTELRRELRAMRREQRDAAARPPVANDSVPNQVSVQPPAVLPSARRSTGKQKGVR